VEEVAYIARSELIMRCRRVKNAAAPSVDIRAASDAA
jgi:hypothetical protein